MRKLKQQVDQKTLEVLVFTSMGMSNKFIVARTGLPVWRIQEIVRMLGIKRVDYRDGRTPLARQILAANAKAVGAAISPQEKGGK